MTTGNFWNLSNPKKPEGLFDPDGVYDIPVDWSAWLAALPDTYGSHVFLLDPGLLELFSSVAGGVITIRIKADPMVPLTVGGKYSFTSRITTTGGQVEDQTLWLKVVEK